MNINLRKIIDIILAIAIPVALMCVFIAAIPYILGIAALVGLGVYIYKLVKKHTKKRDEQDVIIEKTSNSNDTPNNDEIIDVDYKEV